MRRPTEFHYYDWHFNRWFGSETRARCKALGGLLGQAAIGCARELFDYCYKDGSIPSDLDTLASLCSLTKTQMEKVWAAIGPKFQAHKSLPGRLGNAEVDIRRRVFKVSAKQKSHAGVASARKRAADKTNEDSNLSNDRATGVERPLDKKEEIRNKKEETSNRKEGEGEDTPPSNPDSSGLTVVPKALNRGALEDENTPSLGDAYGELWQYVPPGERDAARPHFAQLDYEQKVRTCGYIAQMIANEKIRAENIEYYWPRKLILQGVYNAKPIPPRKPAGDTKKQTLSSEEFAKNLGL